MFNSRKLPPFKVMFLVLIVCFLWNWIRMYKDALASKHSRMLQSPDVPPECRPETMSWLETVKHSMSGAFHTVDKCEEYHKVSSEHCLYHL